MFGFILPVKPEMKIKDFNRYRAYYCGLCKELQLSYGFFSRFLLNYDLVLLAVLADAVSGQQPQIRQEGCFANPIEKRPTCYATGGLRLAADGLMLLSYHKLCDNIADEPFLKRTGYRLAKPFMKHLYKKAAARHPQLGEALRDEMTRQNNLEAAGTHSIDEACDPTAAMCAALFAETADNARQKTVLHRLGLFAGQIIYLLDAAEDYEPDKAHGRYNVFAAAGLTRAQAVESAQSRCRMAAGELAACYNLLTIQANRAILDNIFFLGIPAGIARAGTAQNRRLSKHGQIDSI